MADPTRRQALLVDLDGTFYRGDGPVLAYARTVADSLRAGDAATFSTALAGYLSATVPMDPTLRHATDGWEAVQRLAIDGFGVGNDTLDAAFLASRRALASPDCAVEVPPGLIDALRELRPTTYLVLATNSPADWLGELLARLDAGDVFDDVVAHARKPIGMPGILLGIAGRIGVSDEPWRIFSVGDHWANDIEPARVFGAATGYVDRFGRNDGPADVVAPDVEGVLPTIRRWAADPGAFRRATATVDR
ncbi:MAG TPA: HAD family hydrolase [Pseudonocardiaceae bacterium]|nr:HAD family hydrolase [Pseudonocardiaceae bacterium]